MQAHRIIFPEFFQGLREFYVRRDVLAKFAPDMVLLDCFSGRGGLRTVGVKVRSVTPPLDPLSDFRSVLGKISVPHDIRQWIDENKNAFGALQTLTPLFERIFSTGCQAVLEGINKLHPLDARNVIDIDEFVKILNTFGITAIDDGHNVSCHIKSQSGLENFFNLLLFTSPSFKEGPLKLKENSFRSWQIHLPAEMGIFSLDEIFAYLRSREMKGQRITLYRGNSEMSRPIECMREEKRVHISGVTTREIIGFQNIFCKYVYFTVSDLDPQCVTQDELSGLVGVCQNHFAAYGQNLDPFVRDKDGNGFLKLTHSGGVAVVCRSARVRDLAREGWRVYNNGTDEVVIRYSPPSDLPSGSTTVVTVVKEKTFNFSELTPLQLSSIVSSKESGSIRIQLDEKIRDDAEALDRKKELIEILLKNKVKVFWCIGDEKSVQEIEISYDDTKQEWSLKGEGRVEKAGSWINSLGCALVCDQLPEAAYFPTRERVEAGIKKWISYYQKHFPESDIRKFSMFLRWIQKAARKEPHYLELFFRIIEGLSNFSGHMLSANVSFDTQLSQDAEKYNFACLLSILEKFDSPAAREILHDIKMLQDQPNIKGDYTVLQDKLWMAYREESPSHRIPLKVYLRYGRLIHETTFAYRQIRLLPKSAVDEYHFDAAIEIKGATDASVSTKFIHIFYGRSHNTSENEAALRAAFNNVREGLRKIEEKSGKKYAAHLVLRNIGVTHREALLDRLNQMTLDVLREDPDNAQILELITVEYNRLSPDAQLDITSYYFNGEVWVKEIPPGSNLLNRYEGRRAVSY